MRTGRIILAHVNEIKTSPAPEPTQQSTPPPSDIAKPVSAEQLVSSSEPKPTVAPAAEPVSTGAAPVNKGGRPKGARDTRPRKPRFVQLRNAQGKIIGNVPPPPGTPPPEPKRVEAADFSDVETAAAIDGNEVIDEGLDCRATAEVSFDTGTGILTMVFGNEWQPKSKDEREQVVAALTRYFEIKNVRDIPPGVALTLVLATYSASRFRAPATSGKIKLAWSWLRVKWQNFRARRRGTVPTIRAVPEPQPKEENAAASVAAASP